LDNRTTLIQDISKPENDVKMFLHDEINTLLNDASLQEAVLAHLERATQTRRYELLKQKLEKSKILTGNSELGTRNWLIHQ
jgi:hypothetical protein